MKKDNIILTSNGFNNNGKRSREIENLFREIVIGKKVLIIGNAAKHSNTNSRKDVKENFENLGVKEAKLIDLDENNLNKILEYDVIYVLGGDIGELIELNRLKKFKSTIIKFLEKGIYIGESAGSIITGVDCHWIYNLKKGTKAKYDKEYNDYKGLGLTEILIYPHYDEASEDFKLKIANYEKENNINIIKLNNGEYIKCTYN